MKIKKEYTGIYLITSPSGGQYVGSAINIRRRWHGHRTALRMSRHKNRILQSAWNKYGEENMVFSAVLLCRDEDLLMYEQIVINSLVPRYNIAPLAGNTLGLKWSDESRARKSAQVKGTKHTLETIAKMSLSRTGRQVSQETRERLAAQRGWKHSEETKAKLKGRIVSEETRKLMSLNRIGKPGPRLGQSLSAASRAAISAKLKGQILSSETRAKMSAARKGKPLSDQHRRNQTKTWVELDGNKVTFTEACATVGVSYPGARWRINRLGMTPQEAIDMGPSTRTRVA